MASQPIESTYTRLTYPIPPAEQGRRLVVSDVHGCLRTFDALLDRMQLGRSDQLFLLGDYINKGPDSSGVLERLFALEREGYTLFSLRGNHEQDLLEHAQRGPASLREYTASQQSKDLLDASGHLQTPYAAFMQTLPFFFELDACYLVHAGFNTHVERPFEDLRAMLEIREFEADPALTHGKRIIHGHNPLPLSYILQQFETDQPILPLDNGCVYYGEREEQGNLLGLDLATFALFVQPNVEQAAQRPWEQEITSSEGSGERAQA